MELVSFTVDKEYSMGVLFYGMTDESIQIPDRILDHLRVLFSAKLRRGESFPISFKHHAADGGGRSTIWVHPAIPLRFAFDTDDALTIEDDLLQELARRANTTAGLAIDLNEWDATSVAAPRNITPRPELERAA